MIDEKTSRILAHGLDRDRLGVLSGALLMGLALDRFIETPVRPVGADVLGSPLAINLSATTLMVLVMAGMAVTAVESLVRSHPLARRGKLIRSYHFWIVPGLLIVGLIGWLASFDDLAQWTLGLVAAALIMPLSLAAEYAAVDPEQRARTIVGWGETVLAYLAALILFGRIYDLQTRALLGGTAITLIATLLVVRLIWNSVDRPIIALRYGVGVGLVVGLLSWLLNYLPLSTLAGGLILLVMFYALTGLLQNYLGQRLDRRVALEYIGVAIVTVVLIGLFAA